MKNILLFLTLLVSVCAFAAPGLQIGWAETEITPALPVELSGQLYTRIAREALDPLTATALVLENGTDSVLFLSCDLCGMNRRVMELIRERVKQLHPDIPANHLIVNCTHTHTAPRAGIPARGETAGARRKDGVMTPGGYGAFLIERCADALVRAWRGRKPGGISYGYGYGVVAQNRYTVYFDDTSKRPVKNPPIPGLAVDGFARKTGKIDDPRFASFGGEPDSCLNFLFTFDPAGKLTGILINAASPSQISEALEQTSADYWTEVRRMIRAKYGAVGILPQCAAAGDLMPRLRRHRKAEERFFRLQYGRAEAFSGEFARYETAGRIVSVLDSVLPWASKEIAYSPILAFRETRMKLPRWQLTDAELENVRNDLQKVEEMRKKLPETIDPDARKKREELLRSGEARLKRLLPDTRRKTPPFVLRSLYAVRIGDAALVNLSGEVFTDYMHRIQARSPFTQTFVTQLSPEGTYLPTDTAAARKGYGAIPHSCPVPPSGGQMQVDEAVRLLKSLNRIR